MSARKEEPGPVMGFLVAMAALLLMLIA